ncbi:cytochrome c550 [Bacillus massilinigeriensis]|uniref:cytochrome c550 n=1 Tax=Bacillus mediterraneensis TaxID=1805474 RepID=UPI0008F8B197|nr:cytochrome c [Bacillus mediterraneensis]
MNRNPIIPFVVIMVMGIVLMFALSIKGLGDAKEVAKEKEGGGKKTEEVAANPEDLYKQSCASCHGDQYEGVVGPSLKKVGGKYSKDQIKDILVNGKGSGMPGGLVAGKEEEMAKWLSKMK